MKKEEGLITQNEYFEFILNVENSRVSTVELVGYLSNIDKLFQSINQTLNSKFAIGYDAISIDVIAFEEGSFKIPLFINKVLHNQIFISAAGTLLGGLALNLFSNNSNPQTITTGNETIVVEDKDLLSNRNTSEALGNIAKMTINNDMIRDISITYEKDNGERERVSISKEVLTSIDQNEIQTSDSIESIQTNVTLEIVSPVFMNRPSSWRVLFNGSIINAKMTDLDFLETMDAQRIAFAKGDVIIADLECIATASDKGIRLKHFIRKVHSYPKYTKITRQSEINQKNLFE